MGKDGGEGSRRELEKTGACVVVLKDEGGAEVNRRQWRRGAQLAFEMGLQLVLTVEAGQRHRPMYGLRWSLSVLLLFPIAPATRNSSGESGLVGVRLTELD